MPVVIFQGKTKHINENGYFDILCSLIGKEIISAFEDKKTEKLRILFDNEIEVCISLKLEDRECVEAAMLRMEPGGNWKIW